MPPPRFHRVGRHRNPVSVAETPRGVSSIRSAWKDRAACKGQPLGFFVPDGNETLQGLFFARNWCDMCPVRQECLMWATLHRAEGYWGGTSTHQRQQLVRVRTRAKCPLCKTTQLVVVEEHELCLACGVSWVRDVRLEPLAAKPLPDGPS